MQAPAASAVVQLPCLAHPVVLLAAATACPMSFPQQLALNTGDQTVMSAATAAATGPFSWPHPEQHQHHHQHPWLPSTYHRQLPQACPAPHPVTVGGLIRLRQLVAGAEVST